MVKEECAACMYQGVFEYPVMNYCGYSLMTGHTKLGLKKRADGRCPAFKRGEPAKGESFAGREVTPLKKPRKTKYSREQLRELWERGMNDREIADEMGCAERTISTWRRREGLPPQRERARIRNEDIHQLAAGEEQLSAAAPVPEGAPAGG